MNSEKFTFLRNQTTVHTTYAFTSPANKRSNNVRIIDVSGDCKRNVWVCVLFPRAQQQNCRAKGDGAICKQI